MSVVTVCPEVMVGWYRQGWSQTRIADAAGVSRHRVRTILVGQGVALRPPAGPAAAFPTDRDGWVQRFAPVREGGGWRRPSVGEVSAEFGVSRTVIRRRLSRLEVPPHLVTSFPAPGPAPVPGPGPAPVPAPGLAPGPGTGLGPGLGLGLGVGPTPEQAELWLSRATEWEGRCRRWVFTRALTGYRPYPVTVCGGTRVGVTRLVWSWQHGPVPAGHDIIHTPGCRFADCVHLGHLTCTAVGDRIADQVSQGVFPRGGRHWAAKLTEDQARHILTSPLPYQELATRHGVSLATIQAIRGRRRWKHL